MNTSEAPPSGYRWVILSVFALINAVLQLQWLTFAPIAREARIFYQADALQIDLLSMIFMGVFLLVCIPASYVLDTFGIRKGVGFGAALVGLFGLLKGIFGQSYLMVMVCQTGLAVAQPFIINAVTKVAGRWFPLQERATAVGIATLFQFIGIIIAMIATPMMIAPGSDGSYQIQWMLLVYGVASFVCAVVLLVFLRERPAEGTAGASGEEPINVLEGFRHLIRKRDMQLMLLLFFVGLGMFNALSTCIDQICQLKGLSIEQTGLVGGMMLIAGIVGAMVLPVLSDKQRKRKRYIVLGTVCMMPGLIGLTLSTDYGILLASSFVFGFFLLGAGAPVGFQYATEVCYPAPESISQGLLLFVGQISGILFIVGMNVLGMIFFMKVLAALSIVSVIAACVVQESPLILTDGSTAPSATNPP